jgi:hypothetical protein
LSFASPKGRLSGTVQARRRSVTVPRLRGRPWKAAPLKLAKASSLSSAPAASNASA